MSGGEPIFPKLSGVTSPLAITDRKGIQSEVTRPKLFDLAAKLSPG